METIQGDGLVPPWVKPGAKPPVDVPHPVRTLTDTLELTNPEAAAIPATFILTVEPDERPENDDFWRFAQRAKKRGWDMHTLAADHNPQWSAPQAFSGLIADIAQ